MPGKRITGNIWIYNMIFIVAELKSLFAPMVYSDDRLGKKSSSLQGIHLILNNGIIQGYQKKL